jgi:hypothetical protein
VLISLLGLTLLLGLLPIPQVRSLILLTQSTLTATVGDSLAFVESPVRAALIRECILEGQTRLKQLCKYTVIVAHSQGAAAVLDALGGIRESEEQHEAEATSPLVPDALVTFGAGTNQLASQKVLAAGPKIAWNPASSAVVALLGATGVLFWLYWSVRVQQITVAEILWGLLLSFPIFIVMSLVYWRALIWMRKMSARARIIVAAMVVAVLTATWFSLLWYVTFLYPLSLLFLTSILVAASMYLILSRNMEKIVTAPVQMPPGLNRWVDLYASADPVPNGPTRMRSEDDRHKSIPIWNSGSRFADHTTYWDNRDGFVLRVARVCAETARSPWTDALPGESDFADKRAAWRVGFLQMARWCSGLTLLVLGTFLWTEHQGSIPVPFDLPSWFPPAPVKLALLVAFIAFAMWTTASVLRWPWSRWTRVEQDVVLAQGELGEEEKDGTATWAMAAIVWMLISATFCIVLKVDLTDPTTFGLFLFFPIGPAAISSLVLLRLKRGPRCSSTSDHD